MSIKLKIALLSTLWLIGILVAVNITVYFSFFRIASDNELDWFSNRADVLMKKAVIQDFFQLGNNDLLQSFLPDNGMIRVLDPAGNPVKSFSNNEELNALPSVTAVSKQTLSIQDRSLPILIVRAPIMDGNRFAGTLEMVEKLDSLQENVNILISIMVVSTIGAMGMSFLGGAVLSKLILRPIAKMARTMEEIEKSLVFQKIPIGAEAKDELDALLLTFNRMIERIEESFIRQRQFVSDASHELKTPLTILEGYADMLRRWGLKDEKNGREAVEAIYSEAQRMKHMTQQMLELASTENKLALKEELELIGLCKNTAAMLQGLHHREIIVRAEQDEIVFYADPNHMKQLLMILLDNAIKFSQSTIEVVVQVRNEHPLGNKEGVELRVKDQGIGIPEAELKRVFERFYRVDPARGRKTGGTGLGLSIARNLVRMYNGTIAIQSVENMGTEVIVFLPYI